MPAFRFKGRQPFATNRVDFAGPLYVKVTTGSQQTSKAYICLFTCGLTRATQLELEGVDHKVRGAVVRTSGC
jgi:hypothetical protein